MAAQVMGQAGPSQEEDPPDSLGGDEGIKKKGHTKNSSSISERDRKIGHRRINEEGQVSYKKIQTNQIMGSIQLGIQDSVGGLTKYPDRDLLMHDFMTVETCQFPSKGGSQSPGHPYSDFTFRTYAPVAFRYFRDLFGILPDDFMVSVCNETMRELSNPGASGSIFYLTHDDEFILKTVSLKEAEFLQKLLPGYYMNLQQNPRTLLPKFFGMFTYQCNQKNIRLVVMNNLLPSNIKMHLKFDLKGSTYKRKASKHEREKKSPTFKDLDFLELLPEGLLLEPETYTALVSTIHRDCRVLESFKIMDYSLLLGVHNLDQAARERAEASGVVNSEEVLDEKQGMSQKHRLVAHSTAMESIQATSDPVDIPTELPPGGIPARNHKGERILLFIGLIDILQSYRLIKKLEHTFKAMIHDGDTVSVHRPSFYAERFMNFMSNKIFKKIPSLDLPEVKGNHRKFRTVVASLIATSEVQSSIGALKHSPSKRGKSIKSKATTPSSAPTSTNLGESSTKPEEQTDPGSDFNDPLHTTQTQKESLPASSFLSPPASDPGSQPSSTTCILPAVLRDRAPGQRGGGSASRRGAPPPVPPRSPRGRPSTASSSQGSLEVVWGVRPDVVPSDRGRSTSTCSSGSMARFEDLRLENRSPNVVQSTDSLLGTPSSRGRSGRTPTWTEGTPSYTESSWSGVTQAMTPVKTPSRDRSRDEERRINNISSNYNETDM